MKSHSIHTHTHARHTHTCSITHAKRVRAVRVYELEHRVYYTRWPNEYYTTDRLHGRFDWFSLLTFFFSFRFWNFIATLLPVVGRWTALALPNSTSFYRPRLSDAVYSFTISVSVVGWSLVVFVYSEWPIVLKQMHTHYYDFTFHLISNRNKSSWNRINMNKWNWNSARWTKRTYRRIHSLCLYLSLSLAHPFGLHLFRTACKSL